MTKLTSRERTLIYLAALICLWVVSYRFLCEPLVDSYTLNKQQLTEAKAQLNDLEAYQLKLKAGKTKRAEYESKLTDLEKQLPSNNEAAEILDQVRLGIDNNKLTLLAAEITDETDTNQNNSKKSGAKQTEPTISTIAGVQKLTVNVSVRGDYDAITKLIKGLYEENEARNLIVEQVEFQYKDDKLEAELQLAAYVLEQARKYENIKVKAANKYDPAQPFGAL